MHLWLYNGYGSLGTDCGVAKFKGSDFKIYTPDNSGLSSDGIFSMAIDFQSNKWFSTSGGIESKFDGKNWTSFGNAMGAVSAMVIDNQGNKGLVPRMVPYMN